MADTGEVRDEIRSAAPKSVRQSGAAMTAGVTFLAEEHDLPTESRPESPAVGSEQRESSKILFRIHGLLDRFQNLMVGHRGPKDRGPDPDCVSDDDFERGFHAGRSSGSGGHGSINGNGNRALGWILGSFAAVISVLLTFILNALYDNNGAVRELKGEVTSLQTQINNLVVGRSGVERGK